MDTARPSQNTHTTPLNVRGRNRLLTLLPKDDYERILASMDQIDLKQKDVVQERGRPLSHVYFPLEAVASLIIRMDDGRGVEVGTIGNEGMTGLPLLLDAERSTIDAFIQIPGSAMRMPRHSFREEINRGGAFPHVVRRYAQGFASMTAQSTACNGLHPVEQRLCRWVLMSHDRSGQDHLPLTQEFLAMMLGVQRSSVNLAASMLQKAALIRYSRGLIDVLDRPGLEAASCECYAVVRKEMEELLCSEGANGEPANGGSTGCAGPVSGFGQTD